jgi:uncharacterized protein
VSKNALRIQDSLYGIIDLGHERNIVDSRSFQRLLSVKQLGFAYAVFPGGDYSRFSHSVGANYVVSRMLAALEDYGNHRISEADQKVYRFAALLHDVGHYPFSHAVEDAIRRRYETDVTKVGLGKPYLAHEQVGSALLELDQTLREAIESADVSVDSVAGLLRKKDPSFLPAMISSDIDADRLDYLVRTAHHTGLPYGRIDQDYLVREVRVAQDGSFCWTQRALGALDHVLIGRFYDYQQIVYNKTVVGLEEVLKDVVYALTDPDLGNDGLDLSEAGIRKMISSGDWFGFDDHWLFERIKSAKTTLGSSDDSFAMKCDALVYRNPPRRAGEVGALCSCDFEPFFDDVVEELGAEKAGFADHFAIPASRWWVWSSKRAFTDYKGAALPEEDDEGLDDMVRILDEKTGQSNLAVLNDLSVIGRLCTLRRFIVRVYVLLGTEHEQRAGIEECVQAKISDIWRANVEKWEAKAHKH